MRCIPRDYSEVPFDEFDFMVEAEIDSQRAADLDEWMREENEKRK